MRRRPRRNGWIWVVAATTVAASVAVGCSGGENAGSRATVATPSGSVTTTSDEPEPVTTPSESPSDSAAPTVAPTSVPVTEVAESIATVPDDGVPGIDSANPFCRGWSEFAGSFQTLAFESAAGNAADAARLEVVASGAVTSAAQTLADEFPDLIVAERDVFLDGVVGPFARRAGGAAGELVAAGLSLDDIEQLGEVWLLALVTFGLNDAEIVVDVPDELAGAVDVAARAFAANAPAIAADPSLVTQAEAPATFAYLTDNCPDQGVLAGNDAID